jgi:hypothetical protein
MILLTHGPLEGILVVFADFSRWIGIHEEMIISDLHEGLNPKDGCRDPRLREIL